MRVWCPRRGEKPPRYLGSYRVGCGREERGDGGSTAQPLTLIWAGNALFLFVLGRLFIHGSVADTAKLGRVISQLRQGPERQKTQARKQLERYN
jgi:hypothetical protein